MILTFIMSEEINNNYENDVKTINEIKRLCDGNVIKYEKLLNKAFNITTTFIGNPIYINEPIEFIYEKPKFSNITFNLFTDPNTNLYLYSPGTYLLLFPDYGIRLSVNRDFMNYLLYFDAIINNKFKENFQHLTIKLDEEEDVYIDGPSIYVCRAPIESILYVEDNNDKNSCSIYDFMINAIQK